MIAEAGQVHIDQVRYSLLIGCIGKIGEKLKIKLLDFTWLF